VIGFEVNIYNKKINLNLNNVKENITIIILRFRIKYNSCDAFRNKYIIKLNI